MIRLSVFLFFLISDAESFALDVNIQSNACVDALTMLRFFQQGDEKLKEKPFVKKWRNKYQNIKDLPAKVAIESAMNSKLSLSQWAPDCSVGLASLRRKIEKKDKDLIKRGYLGSMAGSGPIGKIFKDLYKGNGKKNKKEELKLSGYKKNKDKKPEIELTLMKESLPEYSLECQKWSKTKGRCPRTHFINESAKGEEMHFLGIYEPGKIKTDKNGNLLKNAIRVKALKQNSPYSIVLSSYDPVEWEIESAPGAKLKQIHLHSYKESKVKFVGAKKVEIVKSNKYLGYSWFGSSGGSSVSKERLAKAGFNVDSFKTAQGDYGASQYYEVPLKGTVNTKNLAKQFEKDLIKLSKSKQHKKFDEIMNGRGYVGHPAYVKHKNGYYYNNNHDVMFLDLKSGEKKKIEADPGVPRLSWLAAVEYYPPTDELFIVSTWHAGVHHVMNLKTNKRRVFQIKDKGSFVDIVYSPYSKKMYALYKYGVFAEIDKNMNKVKEWKLGDEIRKAIGSGRGGRNSKVWLEVVGKKVLFRIDQTRKQPGDNRIPAKTIDVDGIAFDVRSEKFNSFLYH